MSRASFVDDYLNETTTGIPIRRAEKIFPFMMELNEDNHEDVYDENFIECSEDDNHLTATEQGFMLGYLEA